jgi:hypothetical protein
MRDFSSVGSGQETFRLKIYRYFIRQGKTFQQAAKIKNKRDALFRFE